MVEIIIFTFVYIYFVIFDLYPLYEEKKSFWINAGILSLSYVICILIAIDIQIPSPAAPIKKVIESIVGGQ